MPSLRSLLLALAGGAALQSVQAHPEPPATVEERQSALVKRAELEKRCAPQLAERRERLKMLRKRGLEGEETVEKRRLGEALCTMTPEVTQGPYHILGELVRDNITDGQPGVPLEINAAFIDIATCSPVQVWVDVWHANATGFYSGYLASSAAAGGGGGPGGGSFPNVTGSAPPGGMATGAPTGPESGADTGNMTNSGPTDTSHFLRGVAQTNHLGELRLATIVPGWYTGRAVHVHIKAYQNGTKADNGTFIAGVAHHTGQFFFDNHTLDALAVTYPYNQNKLAWANATKNEEDNIYAYQAWNYHADMDIEWLGRNITHGLRGSILIGLNYTYISPEETDSWQQDV